MRLIAAFALLVSLGACATVDTDGGQPVLGSWHGREGVDTFAVLTLYGTQAADSGPYAIETRSDSFGSHGPEFTPWGGTWTSTRGPDGSTVVDLRNTLNNEIDQYRVAPDRVLAPTGREVGRPLTAGEIRLYSMYPTTN